MQSTLYFNSLKSTSCIRAVRALELFAITMYVRTYIVTTFWGHSFQHPPPAHKKRKKKIINNSHPALSFTPRRCVCIYNAKNLVSTPTHMRIRNSLRTPRVSFVSLQCFSKSQITITEQKDNRLTFIKSADHQATCTTIEFEKCS